MIKGIESLKFLVLIMFKMVISLYPSKKKYHCLSSFMFYNSSRLLTYMYSMIRYKQGKHLLDVTEIFNQLNWAKQLRIFKLVYVILLLVISIFWYCDKLYLYYRSLNNYYFKSFKKIFKFIYPFCASLC